MDYYKTITRSNIKLNIGAAICLLSTVGIITGLVLMYSTESAGFTTVCASILCMFGGSALVQHSHTMLEALNP